MEQKLCFECGGEIAAAAQVCQHCHTRIDGLQCPQCANHNRPQARLCGWCQTPLVEDATVLDIEPRRFAASVAGCLLIRLSFLPQTIAFETDRLIVTTPALFGLTRSNEILRFEKIAGFSHREGLIWDMITIETRGQSGAVLMALGKEDAGEIAELLRRINA
ncbi:hypothetical protein A11A3_00870 [Alcanivorax hongdengensis A-11-3]|uniref:Uncharacterized protein n=1 Tax=Alcanivorax hongdengensis A-11-3 TaxID=1177179 RepID=L0WIL9_9GAMM|nr:zinc ribbon domain-containing protein [Alcanivorax hongdengensis]EKF76002.1 hypothetical protein A11A3_00870 [Alcanivorax hongdengensis A-11-3]